MTTRLSRNAGLQEGGVEPGSVAAAWLVEMHPASEETVGIFGV